MIIGIDVGGTFTDLVAVDDTGNVVVSKVPSMPHNEGEAVLNGLGNLQVPASAVNRLVHGTTVGTNAVIQRQGATIAFVTTYGFRDILALGRAKRVVPGTLFKPFFVRPMPLVPHSRSFEVKERTLFDGQILHPVQEEDIPPLCRQLKNAGVEAVAVCFLNSYADPTNEEQAGRLIGEALDSIPISLSSRVVPEYREYERFSTTALNAYVQPLMDGYLGGLDRTLVQSGYGNEILTIASSGGVMTLETALQFPIRSILSGPAGGIVQSIFLARRLGLENIITYDMGGTSTDVCLVKSYNPVVSTDNLVGTFPLKIPQIDINTVGAGGGSVAWTDVDGSIQVGPDSAGADPGPAAYGRGGTQPTVTDANLLLNRGSARRPLGGSIRLMPDLAQGAFEALLASFPQLSLHELAEGVVRLAVARMCGAIREISVQRGHDPREFVLVAFGGAGPMHATQVAEELGLRKVLIPRFPGNLSAMGLVNSDLKHDYVKTGLSRLSALSADHVAAELAELKGRAVSQLAKEGVAPESSVFDPSLDMRYWGQAFELSVPVDGMHPSLDGIAADFHRQHQSTYGHSDPGAELEVVNYRLVAVGTVEKSEPAGYESPSRSLGDAEIERRPVFFRGQFLECPVYEREKLPPSASFDGPVIVEEFGATTVVFPSWRATVDGYGNLILDHGLEGAE
jgi:N-methylhydantoinase A